MYLWKCWRDSRPRFVVYLVAVVALPFSWTLLSALRSQDGAGWTLIRDASAGYVHELTRNALVAISKFGLFLITLVGMVLGASGVGAESKSGSLDFLLTRPRPRKYFIWVAWGVGALEMLAMIALSALGVFLVVFYLSGGIALWRLMAAIPLLLVAAMVFYGLSYFGTVMARDERNGFTFAVALAMIYAFLVYTLWSNWKIEFPGVSDMLRPVMDPAKPFEFGLMAGWVAFALACPLLAQWIFDRSDI